MVNLFEYDIWNEKKKDINVSEREDVFFREREVWWCSIGLNVGFEENGKGELFNRPVLILKKYGSKTFLGIPISSTKKKGSFYYPITLNDNLNVCLLTHARLLDFRRLTQKITVLSQDQFQDIRKALKDLI